MAYQLWTQDNFSKGELSPFMYARTGNENYYLGLKTAQNAMMYPTGAVGKRFGTLYGSTLDDSITTPLNIFFETFQYLDACVFQLVFGALAIYIYLESLLVATVTTTLSGEQVYNLNSTTLGPVFRVSGAGFKPYDLSVALDGGTALTGVTGNEFTVGSAAFLLNTVVPVTFTNDMIADLPLTVPQITEGVTYFINASSTSATQVYTSSYNAKFNIDPIKITNVGTGTTNINQLNTWTFANSFFSDLPFYDFNANTTSYDALTFTPSATLGSGVTITVSSPGYAPLDSTYVGGVFIGAGGTSRITAVASVTSFTVSVQMPFDSTDPILGSLALLAEPAWSDKRGWPQKCSSYQNRAFFGNTVSLPNGLWGSVINDYPNFGNLTTDDDDAISWFPTSNNVNVIRFIVPFRSITVHTNTGIYSTPLSDISAITPNTFTLQLQDSTPADVVQPQAIDNQIIVLAGNDAHTLLWDGINNAYTSNIISVISEQVILNPVDETPYADLDHAGSRYIFITNANGSMAIFQSLLAEQIAGFTPHITEQSYGLSHFIQAGSSTNGRCWFIQQRAQADPQVPIAVSGFTSSSLTATSSNFSTSSPTAITFTTSGSLPATTPALQLNTYYWAIGLTANTFSVYENQEDAIANLDAFVFTSAGTSSSVVPWPTKTIFTLEELTWDTFLDCAVYFNLDSPSDTISTGALFNAQNVSAVGDGFGFSGVGVSDEFVFESHGSTVDVTSGYIGYPINLIIEPMPISQPPGPQTTLMKPKHVRYARFIFNNTIGGTVNGQPIALNTFNHSGIGEPPIPARGIFEAAVMAGWDDFNVPSFVIEHSDPFDIQLLGIQYSVDI